MNTSKKNIEKYRGSVRMSYELLAEVLGLPENAEIRDVAADNTKDAVTIVYRSEEEISSPPFKTFLTPEGSVPMEVPYIKKEDRHL